MKKILFFGGLLLSAMTFVSCNGDYDDWAEPQTNPQEEPVALPGFTATAAAAIDLNNPGDSVQAFTLAVPALPEGATVQNVRVELDPADAGAAVAEAVVLNASVEGKLDSAEVQGVVETFYGKKSVPRGFRGHVEADIMIDGQAMLVDAGTVNLTITPQAPLYADAYYIVGALNGWDINSTLALLYRQSEGVFSYTTKWTGDHNLKFIADTELGAWDNALGCASDGDASASGTIVEGNKGAIKAPTGDEFYTFTADMTTMTYTWTKLADQNPKEYAAIGVIGDFNGWGSDVAMTQVTPHNWYVETAIAADGGLKFRADGGWTDSWGGSVNIADGAYGTSEYNGGNLTVPAGTYRIYFNDITGEYAFIAE